MRNPKDRIAHLIAPSRVAGRERLDGAVGYRVSAGHLYEPQRQAPLELPPFVLDATDVLILIGGRRPRGRWNKDLLDEVNGPLVVVGQADRRTPAPVNFDAAV